jgi:predicted nuclease of predicted toxin-antitoxin system
VRLLVDANLSVAVAERLREAGHDSVHVRDLGLQTANDETILRAAAEDDRVIISEDTDFGALLARSRATTPSYVLLRTGEPLTPDQQATLLLSNLPRLESELQSGCIAVIGRGRVRVRPLPLRDEGPKRDT